MENKRYKSLQVAEGVYVPQTGINYPEDNPMERLVKPVYDRNIAFDENYPYLDDSLSFKIQNWIGYYMLLYPLVFTLNHIRFGLRIQGREILKKYREELKGGAITISNHMYRLDCPVVLEAVRANRHTRIPMFAANFNTKDNWFMKQVGGIPLPDSMAALKKFNAAFDEFHRRGWWFHIFPEAARWDFYKPLRPFRKGAFTMAYKYGMPIVPCAITYRERTGIYKLFGKPTEPLLTVTIGEPVFPDKGNCRKDEVERMRTEAHLRIQKMAGITHNSWDIVPDDEQ